MPRSKTPIELLHVADKPSEKSMARGLSIKLLPVDDIEQPSSDAEISPPSLDPQEMKKLEELCDTHSKFMENPLPLNRTESRLPSLEDMIADSELKDSVILKGHKFQLLEDITSILAHHDSYHRLMGLRDFSRRQISDTQNYDLTLLPHDAQETFIDNICLFIRQQISKTVDYYRTLVDLKKSGGDLSIDEINDITKNASAEPHELSDEEMRAIYQYMINGRHEYTVERWALISAALNIVRLCMKDESIREMVWKQEIAQSLCARTNFIAVAYISAESAREASASKLIEEGPTSPLVIECADNLLRVVCTFLSNLTVDRDDLREKLICIMWPRAYWVLAFLCGSKFLDSYCLLLQNHFTYLCSHKCKVKESDPQDVRNLKMDFMNLSLTNKQADKAGWTKAFQSTFGDLYCYLILLVNERLQLESFGRNRRHATLAGRAIKAESVSGEWFSLFQLRLLSLGEGHAVIMLCNHILTNCGDFKLPDELAQIGRMPVANPPKFSVEKTLATLVLSLSEYASAPDDMQDQVVKQAAASDIKSRSEQIFGRKWNLVRRAFVVPDVAEYIIRILRDSVMNAENELVPMTVKEIAKQNSSCGRSVSPTLIRPCVKALGSILAAPEAKHHLPDEQATFLWNMSITLVKETATDLIDFVNYAKSHPDIEPDQNLAFIMKTNLYSCRDLLILLSALASTYPHVAEKITSDELRALMAYDQIQDQDVGAREASLLALKIICTKNQRASQLVKELQAST